MADLAFNADTHEYQVDGNIIPSVSQIIKDMGLLPFPPGMDWYLTKGTHVHLATQLYDEDDLDETSLDPVIAPYLTAYKRFRKETQFTPRYIELRLYHPYYSYAGTIDRIGTIGLNVGLVLLDIKSGSPYPAVSLQCAAYAEMARVNDIAVRKAYALYLKADGHYKLEEIKNMRQALSVWLSCLTVYKWKKQEGIHNGNPGNL